MYSEILLFQALNGGFILIFKRYKTPFPDLSGTDSEGDFQEKKSVRLDIELSSVHVAGITRE